MFLRLFHNLGYSHIRPQPYPNKGYDSAAERETVKKHSETSAYILTNEVVKA